MKLLVLDTIHGGKDLARHLEEMGHSTDTLDVYRGCTGTTVEQVSGRDYDLLISPVHLDPLHPVLQRIRVPVISHHAAVRWILGNDIPDTFVEITGARGKTTTAHALCSILPGPGVLHTSNGTFEYPSRTLLWRKSITPASLIPAARHAMKTGGWLVAEVSLGFTGAGRMGILTSFEDYLCAAGRKNALAEKVRSGQGMPVLLVPPGEKVSVPSGTRAGSLVSVQGNSCNWHYGEYHGRFTNPLLALDGYRTPLMLAASAACLLGADPSGLAKFEAVPGRMSVTEHRGIRVIDNANSGVNVMTTVQAAAYARSLSGNSHLTLVIGQEYGAVCEGFSATEVARAIDEVRPSALVIVGEAFRTRDGACSVFTPGISDIPAEWAATLEQGREKALDIHRGGSIVLAVKTWR
jgi:UDP-N-acetylmuramyl pentapeptide synthase